MVDPKLTDRHITGKILLMYTPEDPQKVAHTRPESLNRVRVHLPDPIAVVIARPLALTMADRLAMAFNPVVALPLIGVDKGSWLSRGMNMPAQTGSVGAFEHPKTHRSALAPERADNRRTVVVVGAVAPALVGPSAGRIVWIIMALAFSPAY